MHLDIDVLKADFILSFLLIGGIVYAILLILTLIYHIFRGYFR